MQGVTSPPGPGQSDVPGLQLALAVIVSIYSLRDRKRLTLGIAQAVMREPCRCRRQPGAFDECIKGNLTVHSCMCVLYAAYLGWRMHAVSACPDR